MLQPLQNLPALLPAEGLTLPSSRVWSSRHQTPALTPTTRQLTELKKEKKKKKDQFDKSFPGFRNELLKNKQIDQYGKLLPGI